ncbi:sulfite exporter TauE/SafE family protein [Edaphobacter aggregans]|uniref:sulfite exporter TauE/SafE family protein n=1 Tax=Edaphobacter aggregans TaxID=570835 RepID=UPI00068CCFC4|nr:sulfite exporter TauE/SafE family protein [Edaphobacter aggregans]
MTQLEFAELAWAGSLFAGFLGSLAGLGGGVVIVPMLVLGFHVDVHYAVGASLISVIGTSAGAQAAHGKESFSNTRIGLFLEIATTLGAICGAFLSTSTPTKWIAIIFGVVLLYSAFSSMRPKQEATVHRPPDVLATKLRLNGAYSHGGKLVPYSARRVPLGFGLMFGAGTLSGLLGIGSGAVKVLAMDEAMQIPFKVSTATSNFMIGVTAAASAGVYLSRGYINPAVAMPVTIGVLLGSLLGARFLVKARVKSVRIIFAIVIGLLGAEMIFNGLTGKLS